MCAPFLYDQLKLFFFFFCFLSLFFIFLLFFFWAFKHFYTHNGFYLMILFALYRRWLKKGICWEMLKNMDNKGPLCHCCLLRPQYVFFRNEQRDLIFIPLSALIYSCTVDYISLSSKCITNGKSLLFLSFNFCWHALSRA